MLVKVHEDERTTLFNLPNVVADARERLARTFGWLVIKCGWRAVGFDSELQTTLERPEMAELLKASPQEVRDLKPLCWMLMIETSALYPGVTLPAKAPADVPAVNENRISKPRREQDLGRAPIPQRMLAAVRRGRYGRIG